MTQDHIDEKLIEKYIHQLLKRINKYGLINLNEDSVRYDFCTCLCNYKEDLEPYEIQLECPIDENSYIPRDNPRSKRHERPILDLDVAKLNISVEFALFRGFKKNGEGKVNINKTEKFQKMVNDMIRLGLNLKFAPRKSKDPPRNSYFICVADKSMNNYKPRKPKFEPFPADNYFLDLNNIEEIIKGKTNKIDKRFLKKLNIQIQAKLHIKKNFESVKKDKIKLLIYKITQNDTRKSN